MGTVLRFPVERRTTAVGAEACVPPARGAIVILPVVRIERQDEDDETAHTTRSGGRKHGGGRRRGSRS